MASSLRSGCWCPQDSAAKVVRISDTSQAKDISKPLLLNGYARLHSFRINKSLSWIPDPLPSLPAAKALGCDPSESEVATVLQLAACNLRCWYCFVDYASLEPTTSSSEFISSDHVIDSIAGDHVKMVLDLSGGNPGLIPEWILSFVQSLRRRNTDNIYLWADDNLTVNYYSQYLSRQDIDIIATFPYFGSVGCFKGYSPQSFSFNTGMLPELFANQFEVFRSYLSYGWDIYAYVTFTTPALSNLLSEMSSFVDTLQEIDINLPLRTVPLEIIPYTPMLSRLNDMRRLSMKNQYIVLEAWKKEVTGRFSQDDRVTSIERIRYASRRV